MLNNHDPLLSSAYMFVSHGSRDVRTRWAVEELAERVSVLLASRNIRVTGVIESQKSSLPSSFSPNSQTSVTTTASMVLTNMGCPLVETGTLEFAPLPLHQQIQQFAAEALDTGCERIKILPLFLLPGIHVTEDICAQIEQARAVFGNAIAIEQLPYLGASNLTELCAKRLRKVEADARILFSHGTKKLSGNKTVEEIAEQLGATATYLSVPPLFEEKLPMLIASGQKSIAIQPYLLFEGKTMGAFEQKVMTLQTQFPQVQLLLDRPLGATAELATLIVEQMLLES